MLDGQSLRAARVVIDIGMHLRARGPATRSAAARGTWTTRPGPYFMRQHCRMDEEFLRFELNRYLGWPGQAPSLQGRRADLAAAA